MLGVHRVVDRVGNLDAAAALHVMIRAPELHAASTRHVQFRALEPLVPIVIVVMEIISRVGAPSPGDIEKLNIAIS